MEQKQRPSLRDYLVSILGGALGVQSEKTRQRDFSSGNPWVYILGGLTFTVLFILILVGIVSMVVP